MIYSDWQILCRMLNDDLPNFSYAGCVIGEYHTLKRHFELVSFRFICRLANQLGHALARFLSY